MSIKEKPTLEKSDSKNSSNGDPEKTGRSDSNISHSSWIYKLTASPTPTKTNIVINTENKDETDNNKDAEKNQMQEKSENIESIPNEQQQQETKDDEKGQLTQQNNNSGIWSWLGYSGSEQQQQPSSDPKSVTVAPPETPKDSKNDESLPQESIKAAEANQPNRSTANATPQKPSYWRSLFSSSAATSAEESNNRDSVIIDNNEEQIEPPRPPIEEKQDSPVINDTNSAPSLEESTTTRKIPIPPSRHNVVLPTFESQFHAPPLFNTDQRDNSSIFCKAMNAINSIFTQKPEKSISSDWQDIHYLSTLIDTMKSDPEHVAGKKIVIIGVHGWFPMKVCSSYYRQVYFSRLIFKFLACQKCCR